MKILNIKQYKKIFNIYAKNGLWIKINLIILQ